MGAWNGYKGGRKGRRDNFPIPKLRSISTMGPDRKYGIPQASTHTTKGNAIIMQAQRKALLGNIIRRHIRLKLNKKPYWMWNVR